MTASLDTFAKVRALHDRTDNPGEKAAAAGRMEALARSAGMTVKQAKSKLDRQAKAASKPEPGTQAQAAANAFKDLFNTPEMRAQRAERERERQAKCARLLETYGTEDAVFADTEREVALRKACEPLTVWNTRPDWSGCYSLAGWSDHGGGETMPAAVREAVTAGWPWPNTVAAAWAEYEAAERLDSDRCAFCPDYSPHRWVEARRYALEDLLDTHPAKSLNDICARMSWLEHLSSLQSPWTHDNDRARFAVLRADIERMGARLREQDADAVQFGQAQGYAQSACPSRQGGSHGEHPSLIQSGHPRRTNADKRRDVLALLNAGNPGIPLSDREIARRAGVSPQTVGNIRRSLP